MTTLERLHELVEAVPAAERDAAARALEVFVARSAIDGPEFFAADSRTQVLHEDARVIEDISALRGDFWQEDEPIDDFVRTLRAWRRDDSAA